MSQRPVIVGVPVLNRYDLLFRLIESLAGVPFAIVDNGGKMPEHLDRLRELARRCGLAAIAEQPEAPRSVAASWNHVLMTYPRHDVVLCNDDVVVAPGGIDLLRSHPEPLVLAQDFSCFLHRPEATAAIGYYDETFSPAYFEDNDYAHRARIAGVPIGRAEGVTLPTEGSSTRAAMTEIQRKALDQDFEKNKRYYFAKWGGFPGQEQFTVPFDGRIEKDGNMGTGPQTAGEIVYEVGRALRGQRRLNMLSIGGANVRMASHLAARTRGDWTRWCVGDDVASTASEHYQVIVRQGIPAALKVLPKGRFDLVVIEKAPPPDELVTLLGQLSELKVTDASTVVFGLDHDRQRAVWTLRVDERICYLPVAGGTLIFHSKARTDSRHDAVPTLQPWDLESWLATDRRDSSKDSAAVC